MNLRRRAWLFLSVSTGLRFRGMAGRISLMFPLLASKKEKVSFQNEKLPEYKQQQAQSVWQTFCCCIILMKQQDSQTQYNVMYNTIQSLGYRCVRHHVTQYGFNRLQYVHATRARLWWERLPYVRAPQLDPGRSLQHLYDLLGGDGFPRLVVAHHLRLLIDKFC